MTGWKTYFGAGVSIITGIYTIVVEAELVKGLTLIAAGLGLVGIGHKIEKSTT